MNKQEIISIIKSILENYPIFTEKDSQDLTDLPINFLTGATKFVILNGKEVIKIPFSGYFDHFAKDYYSFKGGLDYDPSDYCLKEIYLYHLAKKEKISSVFLKTNIYEILPETRIYRQERITETYFDSLSYAYPEELDEERQVLYKKLSNGRSVLSDGSECWNWFIDVYLYYGANFYNRLIKFLDDNSIDDLHGENLGYIDNQPIILDYAGFSH